jgi:hypothetical protein
LCRKHNALLFAVLCWGGIANSSSAADWLQLQGLRSISTLLLPHHRPPLLPAMVENGIAGALCSLLLCRKRNALCLLCSVELVLPTAAVQQTGCSCRA